MIWVIPVPFLQAQSRWTVATGATSVLEKAGFPAANIFNPPQAKTDTKATLNAAVTVVNAHPEIEH